MKSRVAVFGLSSGRLLALVLLCNGLSPGTLPPLPLLGVTRAGAQEAPKFYVVATSPDGKLTAERSTGRQFRVREGDQVLWQREDLKISDTQTAIFSPDSRLVVTLGWETQLWEARTGTPKATLHSSDFPTIVGAIAPDGRTLAAGSWDSIMRFWNIETGEALGEWKGVGGAVKQVQWLDDGKSLLLSLYSNRTDKLRSKAVINGLISSGGFSRRAYPGGQELWKAMPHEDEVSQVAFASGGKQMLSSGRDGQAFLWNVETGVNRLVDISTPRSFGGYVEF
jgi:WD40 repeat protein